MILYAIPTPLGTTAGGAAKDALTPAAIKTVLGLKDFAVENAKSARAFLGELGMAVRELSIVEIQGNVDSLLKPLKEGRAMGLLSEAGCPAIADPGAALVEAAHREGFRVVPLVGPSSIVLALMASGLEGQRFAFCGYLPRETADRVRKIRELEQRSRKENETEIFIETPYRNDAMVHSLLETCAPATRLCIASNLTMEDESVQCKPIAEWRRSPAAPGKRPTVFLMLARS